MRLGIFILILLLGAQTIFANEKDPYKKHGLQKWFKDSQSFVTESSIDLNLPEGSRKQKVPVSIRRATKPAFSNVGEGWMVSIPFIEIDRSKNIASNSNQFYNSSDFGPLVTTREGDLVPQLQQDDSNSIFKKVVQDDHLYYALYNSDRPREIWYFGSTQESRLAKDNNAVMWMLDRIETVDGDTIVLDYSSHRTPIYVGTPQLETISYNDLRDNETSLKVKFEYDQTRPNQPVNFSYGLPTLSSKHLTRVVVIDEQNQRELYQTSFEYQRSNWQGSGQLYLKKVMRSDSNAISNNPTPLFEVNLCNDALCLDRSGPEVQTGRVELNQNQLQEFKTYRAKFAEVGPNGIPQVLLANNNFKLTKAAVFSKKNHPSKISYLGISDHVTAGVFRSQLGSSGFTSETIWNFTDFNGDGYQDLWWVPVPTLQAPVTSIKIAISDRGSFYSNNILDANFGVKLTEDAQFRFVRLSEDTSFSIVSLLPGSGKVRVTKWSKDLNRFVTNKEEYSKVFVGDGTEYPIYHLGSNLLRFSDINGDGNIDWVELPGSNDQKLRYFPGLGDGRFDSPVKCSLPSSLRKSAIEFLDINQDGYPDLIELQKSETSVATIRYMVNQEGQCFAGRDGSENSYAILDLPAGSMNGKTGKNRFLLDINGDGRQDIVSIFNTHATYISFGGKRPRADRITKISYNSGRTESYKYAPISDFYNGKPLMLGSANTTPQISGGLYVVRSKSINDSLNPAHSRLTSYRYFGPTYWFKNNHFSGFKVVEVTEHGDASQYGITMQRVSIVGSEDNPYNNYLKSERNYDLGASGQEPILIERKDYKKVFLGEYLKNDPLNKNRHTYRIIEKMTMAKIYSCDSENSLIKKTSQDYLYELNGTQYSGTETYKTDVRLKKACNGRVCKELTYTSSFKWTSVYSGITFENDQMVGAKKTYSQNNRDEYLGYEKYTYNPRLGLIQKYLKCSSLACDQNQTNQQRSYDYNEDSYPVKMVSPRGTVTVYERDEIRPFLLTKKVETTQEGLILTTSYLKYNPLNRLLEIKDPRGLRKIFQHNPQGYLVGEKQFGIDREHAYYQRKETFDMASRSLRTLEFSPVDTVINSVKENIFNIFGDIVEKRVVGTNKTKVKKYEFGPRGKKQAEYVDAFLGGSSKKQTTIFDALGRPIAIHHISGLTTKINRNGKIITVTKSDPNTDLVTTKRFEQNAYGEIIKIENAKAASYEFIRNANGKISLYRDPLGIERRFVRDLLNRLTTVEEKKPNSNRWHILRKITYGVDDKPEFVVQARGSSIAIEYDSLGRKIKKTSQLPDRNDKRIVTYKYDTPSLLYTGINSSAAIGQLTQVEIDPGITKDYLYNDRGLVAEVKMALNRQFGGKEFVERYEYNAFGELSFIHYPDGEFKSRYIYDEMREISQVEIKSNAHEAWQTVASYKRTAFNSQANVIYGNKVTTSFNYELGTGRLDSIVSVNETNKKVMGLEYELDAFNNVKSITDRVLNEGEAVVFSFEYDNEEQLTKAKGPFGVLDYAYHKSGRIEKFEGITFEYDKNHPMRLAKRKKEDGQILNTYEYDENGNRIRKGDFHYIWNANNKLAAVCKGAPCSDPNTKIIKEYYYDNKGRRIAKVDGDTGKISTIYFGKTFEIRGGGKTWIRHVTEGIKGQRILSIASKGERNLASNRTINDIKELFIGTISGNINDTFLSAYTGIYIPQLTKNPTLFCNFLVWSSVLVISLIGGFGLLRIIILLPRLFWTEVNAIGNLARKYTTKNSYSNIGFKCYLRAALLQAIVVLLSITIPVQGFADEIGENNPLENKKITLYYHYDHIGNNSVITDENGSVVDRNVYKPFGALWSGGNSVHVRNLFHGHDRDLESGLDYRKARMYDSEIGQFISRDPLFETKVKLGIKSNGELSLYNFAKNNPLKYKDPTGLFVTLAAAVIIGAAVGALVGGYRAYKKDKKDIWAIGRGMLRGAAIGALAGLLYFGAVSVALAPAQFVMAGIKALAGAFGYGCSAAVLPGATVAAMSAGIGFGAAGTATVIYQLGEKAFTGKSMDWNEVWQNSVIGGAVAFSAAGISGQLTNGYKITGKIDGYIKFAQTIAKLFI